MGLPTRVGSKYHRGILLVFRRVMLQWGCQPESAVSDDLLREIELGENTLQWGCQPESAVSELTFY